MTTSLRRGRQLLALALASTTVVVAAGASAASAAPAATTTSTFSGTADSSTVQLIVTLPTALDAVTGLASSVLPNPIDLSLIRSTGKVIHDGSGADTSTSTEDLAQSSLLTNSPLSALLAPVLSHTVTSSLASPNPSAFNLASVPANPLGLNLALTPLMANTNTGSKATTAQGGVATSALASLSTLAPSVTAPLQSALGTVNDTLTTALNQLTAALQPVSGAVSPVTGALTTVLGSVPTIAVPATPLTPAVTVNLSSILGSLASDPVGTLTNTLNQIPALLAKVEDELLNGAAVSLDGISSLENVVPAGSGTSSTATANVATINLFGGLIQVQATKASASASAPGTNGKATAASTATLLKVQVGQDLDNILTVLADDSGLTAGLLGGITPQVDAALAPVLGTVNSAVASVLSTVTGLLQSLNSDAKILQQGTATHSVTADGTHAEAAATPAQIVLGLPGAPNLIALSLGSVSVVANQKNTTTANIVKAPTVAKVPNQPSKPVAPTKKLAYTGADLPLTAGAALVLLGAAAGVARRRRSHTA